MATQKQIRAQAGWAKAFARISPPAEASESAQADEKLTAAQAGWAKAFAKVAPPASASATASGDPVKRGWAKAFGALRGEPAGAKT